MQHKDICAKQGAAVLKILGTKLQPIFFKKPKEEKATDDKQNDDGPVI